MCNCFGCSCACPEGHELIPSSWKRVSSDCEKEQITGHLQQESCRRAQDQQRCRGLCWQAVAEKGDAFPPPCCQTGSQAHGRKRQQRSLLPACCHCVQAAPAGRRHQAAGKQVLQPSPARHSLQRKALRERCSLLSPRAAQVLRRLEPHLHQQEAFASMAERNRQKQAKKRQHHCCQCWYHCFRGKDAENNVGSGGAPGKGAGKLSSFPPL